MSFTQAQIDAEINNQLLSGSDITALTLRGVLHDMNASAFQSIPPPTVGLGTVLNALSASSYSWTSTPSLGVNGGPGGSLQLNDATSGNVTLATAGSTFIVQQGAFGTMLSVGGPGAAIANQIATLASTTGNAPTIQAIGTDTNVNLALQGQGGSGAITLNGVISILNGIQIGAPAGGDKGAGKLNSASTIYVNNDAVEAAHRMTGTVGATGSTDFSLTLLPGSSVIGVPYLRQPRLLLRVRQST
jgi:hypothetical protein